jgi:hypothetical protein
VGEIGRVGGNGSGPWGGEWPCGGQPVWGKGRVAAASRGTAGVTESLPARGNGGRHRAEATAGQVAPARGAAGQGRRLPALARGDDAIAGPGRCRRLFRPGIVTAAVHTASAGECVKLSRPIPQALSRSKLHARAQLERYGEFPLLLSGLEKAGMSVMKSWP